MADMPMDRLGGKLLVVGGLLWIFASLFHPDVTSTATSVNTFVWALVHWAYLVGDLSLVGGLILVARSLSHTEGSGWAALALAGGGLSATLDAASTGIHLLSFPGLTEAIGAGTATAQATLDATQAVNASVGGVGFVFQCMTVAILGFAFVRAGLAPGLAYVGIILGAAQVVIFVLGTAGHDLLPTTGLVANINAATLPLWITAAGAAFASARGREG